MGKSVLDLINKKDVNTISKKNIKNVFQDKNNNNKLSIVKKAAISVYVDKLLEFLIKNYVEENYFEIRGSSAFAAKLFEQYLVSILSNNKEGISLEEMRNKSLQFDSHIQESLWNNNDFWKVQGNDLSEKYTQNSKLPVSGVDGGNKIIGHFLVESKELILEELKKENLKANYVANLLFKSFFFDNLYFVNETFGLDTKGLVKNENSIDRIKDNNLIHFLKEHLKNN